MMKQIMYCTDVICLRFSLFMTGDRLEFLTVFENSTLNQIEGPHFMLALRFLHLHNFPWCLHLHRAWSVFQHQYLSVE